jgi:hypothetical protein
MKMTTAEIAAIAYDRSEYENRMEHKMICALLLFYRARLAVKNGKKAASIEYRKVDQIIDGLVAEIRHPIRGFTDRRKAFARAVAETKAADMKCRRYASLNAKDTADFWAMVQRSVEADVVGRLITTSPLSDGTWRRTSARRTSTVSASS